MLFIKNQLYHIYNQGNNRQKIFFNRENYLFFLKKAKPCFEPFADIFAWCLMPNHFHFLVLVNEVEVAVTKAADSSDDLKSSDECTPSTKNQTLNQSLAVLLRSYTRAINKQEGTTGSLFRQKTKAECLTDTNGITPSFFNTNSGTLINDSQPEKEYPQICFNYIHQNPVVAGLVKEISEWEFSSARDYYANRNGKLINREKAKEYIVF
jgi:putative transposase